MKQDHVWVLQACLIELCPDAFVIVAIYTAGEGDLGPGRDQHFGFGAVGRRSRGAGDAGGIEPVRRISRIPSSLAEAASIGAGIRIADRSGRTAVFAVGRTPRRYQFGTPLSRHTRGHQISLRQRDFARKPIWWTK